MPFWNWLENPYDNNEEDNSPRTMLFLDTPVVPLVDPDAHITDTNNQNLDYTTNYLDSLNKTYNFDPDNMTIMITGANDQVPTIQPSMDDPVVLDSNNYIDDVEHTGVDDHNTDTTEVEDYQPNNNTKEEQDNHIDGVPQRSKQIQIKNQGVEQTEVGFDYINLQCTVGNMDPCSIPKEMII